MLRDACASTSFMSLGLSADRAMKVSLVITRLPSEPELGDSGEKGMKHGGVIRKGCGVR